MKISAIVLGVLVAHTLFALTQPQRPTGPVPEGESSEAPIAKIVFTREDPIPLEPIRAAVWDYPLQCAGDRFFFNVLMPPEYLNRQLYAISKSKGVVRYSILSARDLYNIGERSYFPVDSGVVFLVAATRSDRKGKYTSRRADGGIEERTGYVGGYHDYLAKFDSDGIYRGAVEIDKALMVSNVGIFDSGTYLAFGLTVSDRTNHFAILDSDGRLLRLIDPPGAVDKIAESEAKAFPGLHHVITPWTQFVNFRGKILVVPHSAGTILEVSPAGEVRVVNLKLPAGLEIDSFLPSADHWYARVGPPMKIDEVSEAHDLSKIELFEFDSETGSVLRQLQSENIVASEIACEMGGEFVAFQWDQKGQLKAMRGTVR